MGGSNASPVIIFWGSILILSINYDLQLTYEKLLKRQSKKKSDLSTVCCDIENRSVYVLLPFHPQGPSRVPWKSKNN